MHLKLLYYNAVHVQSSKPCWKCQHNVINFFKGFKCLLGQMSPTNTVCVTSCCVWCSMRGNGNKRDWDKSQAEQHKATKWTDTDTDEHAKNKTNPYTLRENSGVRSTCHAEKNGHCLEERSKPSATVSVSEGLLHCGFIWRLARLNLSSDGQNILS